MVMTIDEAHVSQLIRSVVGQDEDAFQQSWLEVIEKQQSDNDESIRQISADIKHKSVSQFLSSKYRDVSLESPAYNTEDSPQKADVLPSPDIRYSEAEDAPYRTTWSVRSNRRLPSNNRTIQVDKETICTLQKRYPGIPLWKIIRSLAGLPLISIRECFQPWEDEIIKKIYPGLGAKGVRSQLPNRHVKSIFSRAKELGLKFDGHYHPIKGWWTTSEVAKKVGVSQTTVNKWISNQLLKTHHVASLEIGTLLAKHHYVDSHDLSEFIRLNPTLYDPQKLQPFWRQYIPTGNRMRCFSDIAKETGIAPGKIQYWQDKEYITTVVGYRDRHYADIDKVRSFVENPKFSEQRKKLRRPYKVVRFGIDGPTHFLKSLSKEKLANDCFDRKWLFTFEYVCRRGIHRSYARLDLVRSYPTCKVCLAILKSRNDR